MRLILNESELLTSSLNNGYVDNKKPSNTIRILVKHFLSIGMNKEQTYESINKFLVENYKEYNSVNWYKIIKGIINKIYKSKNYQMFDVKPIKITESEINKIKILNDIKLEKLAFVLLVYAKIYNQMNNNDSNWVNEHHRHIFSDAKIAVTKNEQGKMIHTLKEKGYVDVSVMVDCTNIKVNYIENDSEIAITISDFRNFVYEYLKYFSPDKYIQCTECNKLIKPTNNRQIYCGECWEEKERKLRVIINKRYYEKNKIKTV